MPECQRTPTALGVAYYVEHGFGWSNLDYFRSCRHIRNIALIAAVKQYAMAETVKTMPEEGNTSEETLK